MRLILSVYLNDIFKEFPLPAMNNADYPLFLSGDYFSLKDDFFLNLEVLDHRWRICDIKPEEDGFLRDQELIRLPVEEQQMTLIVRSVRRRFYPYRIYRLLGDLTIGREQTNDIVYDFQQFVSKVHGEIRRTLEGVQMISYSKNGIYINGQRIAQTQKLKFGDSIDLMGLHMVFLGEMLAVDVEGSGAYVSTRKLLEMCREGTDGVRPADKSPPGGTQQVKWSSKQVKQSGKVWKGKEYHRSPRNDPGWEGGEIAIELPPVLTRGKEQPLWLTIGPSLTMALPMLLGFGMMGYASQANGASMLYLYSGLVMTLSSAILGVIWTLAGIRQQKKEERKEEKHLFDTYSAYLMEKRAEVSRQYRQEREWLLRIYTEPALCMEKDQWKEKLWSRNRFHDDFLTHRLGLGDRSSGVSVAVPEKKFALYACKLADAPYKIRDAYQMLHGVPGLVDLKKHTLIGVVGGAGKERGMELVRILSAQIAANNCYTDVKMGFLYHGRGTEDQKRWAFARWLPHVWSEDRKIRYMASNRQEAGEVCYELAKIFRSRQEQKESYPHYILFVEEPSFLEGELLSRYVFDQERDYGLTTILLADRWEELPNACTFFLENTEQFQGMYQILDGQRQKLLFDYVEESMLERFARDLSGLRVLEVEKGGEIPESLTFFEMLHITSPQELPVAELWAKNRTYEHIRGIVGQKAGGVPCYLDIHEKYHGPHGLVAGTTGSGKSETLQTYLLSLAVNYSPDDLAFFLIDYKGGGMANLFEGLPHLAGQISNLSGNQIRRAMISIKSENQKRQRIFAEYGVNNINLYTKLYKNGETSIPIPHLVLVIDEFAELKREEPDFLKELISVAQVGRSLGVHLILATQKPGGTVDDHIWSNAKFHLCLRVQDKQDSNDMLHKPDAACLTQPGRCYLQVGNDEVYELFQSGYSGAPYEEQTKEESRRYAALITLTGKEEFCGMPAKRVEGSKDKRKERTQLEAVKEYLACVARQQGYGNCMKLWMPLLPTSISLNQLETYGEKEKTGRFVLLIGLVDAPENQTQLPLKVDFTENGHVAICGSVVSGKSTLMQTILYGLIQTYTPKQVWIYGIDVGGKMLAAFEHTPHVGGILQEGEEERTARFFYKMERTIKERKELLGGVTYSQYIQARDRNLPAIFLFVDNYGAFQEKTKERYHEQMIRMGKEGANYGIYLVISGNGVGMKEIPARLFETMGQVLCIQLPDKYSYAELLHGSQPEVLPEQGVRGRGLALLEGRMLEFQAALAVEAKDDYERMEVIKKSCRKMEEEWKESRAEKIPEIPKEPSWSAFEKEEEVQKAFGENTGLPIGYDLRSGAIYRIPLNQIYCYTIFGNARTGKTNFLKVCLESARKKGGMIGLLHHGEGEWAGYEQSEHLRVAEKEEEYVQFFEALVPVFRARNQKKQKLLEEGCSDQEIFSILSKEVPYFIFLADLVDFVSRLDQMRVDLRPFLENIISKGSLHHIYFFGVLSLEDRSTVAGDPIYESFIHYRRGIHLGGRVSENPVLSFDTMPYAERERSLAPGMGLLPETEGSPVCRIVIPQMRRKSQRRKENRCDTC